MTLAALSVGLYTWQQQVFISVCMTDTTQHYHQKEDRFIVNQSDNLQIISLF